MARYDDAPLPYSSSGPMPTRNPTLRRANTRGGGTVKRSKTLTRPERHVAPEPLINPAASAQTTPAEGGNWNWWVLMSWIATFYAPPAVLRACGIKDKQTQQAWREKVTLCTIAVILMGFVGFFTMGIQSALCPGGDTNKSYQLLGSQNSTLSIAGYAFDISESAVPEHVNFYQLANNMSGQDITQLFQRSNDDFPACQGKNAKYATSPLCPTKDPSGTSTDPICSLPQLNKGTVESLKLKNLTLWEGYSWEQVAELDDYLVLDGFVLNMAPYLAANPNPIDDDPVDEVIRRALSAQRSSGKDVTNQFYHKQELRDAIPCMTSRYLAGHIDKMTPGCFVAALFLYLSLGVILGVVLIRFFMAVLFNWFLARRLVEKQRVHGHAVSPTVMPEGANVSVNNQNGTAPWANGGNQKSAPAAPIMDMAQIGQDLFTVCLITCYSEGQDGIKGTLDSIAGSTFPDQRKLLWIVCDGMITGAGEKMSTPDICVSMLDADPRFGNPQPMGYIAVGSGSKKENRAMVYAGHYVTSNGHRTPTVVVVKCGMPSEANDAKPGNRGKRDSQLILMNFFSRCTYNDRMSPLDYDLFRKVQTLMGVTPDFFELCLMVDADTVILPDAFTYLVHTMANDNRIMGACGETRIANKRQSWVTAIQVFEYYISHHLIKSFESVFGGVTCLPGCFSMYRIKARKDDDDDWIPILVKPEIVREYSQSNVVTLHQKNLLLLGEDRFLSTIMLRTFPHRRNVFVPQARCRTIAPDEFKVLLSQRRRWINSTIHNLMELVLVRDLCGTFCFSMQFVVFMDLFGTIVLPIAICLTGALVINSIIKPPKEFVEAIPLMLLAAILGLPAVLIAITTRKMIYVAWMMVYLCALPVWNFVLPVYSFWHFDDFSWGETRKVEGEVVDKAGHGAEAAIFDGTTIPLRRWEDWERSRLRKLRREEKRRKQLERQHGAAFYNDNPDELAIPRNVSRAALSDDQQSIISSEEDVWGAEIGGYNENHPAYPPPPMALAPHAVSARPGTQVLGMEEMAALLDQGFEEPPAAAWRPERNESSPLHRHPAQAADGYTRTPRASPPNDYRPLSPRSPGSSGGGSNGYAQPLPAQGYAPQGYAPASTGVQLQDHGATSTSIESGQHHQGQHARQRSKTYGPLGPLDDQYGAR